jgi:hypothetical protein
MIYGLSVHNDDADDSKKSKSTQLVNQIKSHAELMSHTEFTGDKYLSAMKKSANPVSVFKLHTLYSSEREYGISRHRKLLCDKKESQIIDALFKLAPQLSRIIYTYESSVERLIENLRRQQNEIPEEGNDPDAEPAEFDIDRINNLQGEDKEHLGKIYNLFLQLVSVYKIRNEVSDIAKAIILEKNRLMGVATPITFDPRAEALKDAKIANEIPDYEFN